MLTHCLRFSRNYVMSLLLLYKAILELLFAMIPSNQSKDACKKVSLIVSIKNIPYKKHECNLLSLWSVICVAEGESAGSFALNCFVLWLSVFCGSSSGCHELICGM